MQRLQAPTPVNETQRLAALEAYRLLDTEPEASFDDLTWLASSLCHAPIAVIGLVDSSREIFKSRLGLNVSGVPRTESFGTHALLQKNRFEIEDAARDRRFRDHPLVVGDPHIRFYAATPLVDPEGNPLGVLAVADSRARSLNPEECAALERLGRQAMALIELRSARSRAQAALREGTEKHAALNVVHQELRALSYIISHDLRAPLINLMGFSGEMRKLLGTVTRKLDESQIEGLDPEILPLLRGEIPRAMEFIAGAATRMSGQLDVVLKLFRLGRYELNPEPVNLACIFQSVVETHVRPDDRTSVRLDLDAMPDLYLDSEAIYILANNLVSNALKYRQKGRPCRVEVSATHDESGVTLCVADNGRGIAPEDHDEIFKLFRRCGRQDTKGEGVGLTFCRTLVNRMGGHMWLESEPGLGSKFFVFLPGTRAAGAKSAEAGSAAA